VDSYQSVILGVGLVLLSEMFHYRHVGNWCTFSNDTEGI